MPTVSFTAQLERFLPAPTVEVGGATLGDALAAVFAAQPALRGYVLDDQGALRQHVAVFVNGRNAVDRERLTDPVGPTMKSTSSRRCPEAEGGNHERSTLRRNPQGPVRAAPPQRRAGRSPTRSSWATRCPPCWRTGEGPRRARPRPFRRQAVAPRRQGRMARTCRPRLPGQAGRCRRRPASLVARQDLDAGAGRRAAGGSRPAPCRAGCSAPTTTARAGRSTRRSGTCPRARSGWASPAASSRGSAPCWSIRAIPTTIRVGVSCAGVWATTDGGATWANINEGMYNEYMPPNQRREPIAQDIHQLAHCAGAPGGRLVPAPQRHLSVGRRRRTAGAK